MDLGLQGKTALVLAASGGIGGAIAEALAREGARVAISGRNTEALERTRARLGGAESMMLSWELGDLDAVERNIAAIEARWGSVDILVNNTGGPPTTPAAGQPLSLWEEQFRAMVLSVIAITDRVLPGMKARKWGRIITSTSAGVEQPIPNLGLSNALRMSLVGWSKTLSREVAKDGITANIVVPGRIDTERVRSTDAARAKREGKTPEQVAAESQATIPMGRYGRPEEYAAMVAFLASTQASYVTGAVIRCDGGLIAGV